MNWNQYVKERWLDCDDRDKFIYYAAAMARIYQHKFQAGIDRDYQRKTGENITNGLARDLVKYSQIDDIRIEMPVQNNKINKLSNRGIYE